MFVLFFFFFQAEDGIRDLTVTGVQTCALPIWFRDTEGEHGSLMAGVILFLLVTAWVHRVTEPAAVPVGGRSEERRVGKEGRSRWAPDHLKKKKEKNNDKQT